MHKEKKIIRLQRLLEEGKYNMKELTIKVYGNYSWNNYGGLNSLLSYLRRKGFHYHAQGANGIVKIPENLEEGQIAHRLNYGRTKGKLLRYVKFIRWAILEIPALKKEIKSSVEELGMIAQNNPTLKLYANNKSRYPKIEARPQATQARD